MNSSSKWTFLTNHAHVLICLESQPDARIRDLAQWVRITERAVQNVIADLENVGAITRCRNGRRNSYVIHPDLPLRHPVEAHRTIGDILRAVRPLKDQSRNEPGMYELTSEA